MKSISTEDFEKLLAEIERLTDIKQIPRGTGRVNWENKVVSKIFVNEKFLNEFGAEGWELAAVVGGTMYFFKRPI